MKLKTSRVATLVGLLGLTLGAVLGAGVDNFLERGRNFEKSIYERQADAILQLVIGKQGGPNAEINSGRMLLALTADAGTVRAIRAWMKWEQNTEKERGITDHKHGKMHTCGERDKDLMDIYVRLRESMRGEGRSWLDWLPLIGPDKVHADTVWEVYRRCLFADRK